MDSFHQANNSNILGRFYHSTYFHSFFLITLCNFEFECYMAKYDRNTHADDNNGNDKKPCNDQHSDSSTKCSQKDTTPFILPFP
jgi:hypothetical protein